MKDQAVSFSVYDTAIKLVVLFLIVAWCLLIVHPFASVILWSLILALAMHPLHKRLGTALGGRPRLASVLIVFSVLAVILLPVWMLIQALIGEIKDLKVSFDHGALTIPPPSEKVKGWPIIGSWLYDTWQTTSANLGQTLVKYQDQLLGVGRTVGVGILSAAAGVIQMMAALVIAGLLLVFGGTGEGLRKFFRKVAGRRGDEFADMSVQTIRNVVKGVIGVALILALLNGVLFLLAGVPYAALWTFLVFILAVLQIPLFIVTVPVMIYFFAFKETLPAILWSASLLVVGLSDNILRPILLGKGAPVPMLVIFMGVIGGFVMSGFIGLFTGAIVLSLGYKLFIEWIESEKAGNGEG